MLNDVNVDWKDDTALVVQTATSNLEYAQGKANQLIKCARMNPWDRFIAMLQKNTDQTAWEPLNTFLTSLDTQTAWKFKEKFARLQTRGED